MTFSINAEPLDNIEKVEGGYLISDENMIVLADYIEELRTENEKLKSKNEALNEALNTERQKVNELIVSKNEVIKLQGAQIERLERAVKEARPSIFDKAMNMAGGAGIASVLILFAVLQ